MGFFLNFDKGAFNRKKVRPNKDCKRMDSKTDFLRQSVTTHIECEKEDFKKINEIGRLRL